MCASEEQRSSKAAFRPGVRPDIVREVSWGNFERLAEYEGIARQDGEFFVITGDMSRYRLTGRLGRELTAWSISRGLRSMASAGGAE